MIFAVIVIGITIANQFYNPQHHFSINDIYMYMIAAFIGTVPGLIFYTRRDISEKQMRIRMIIHFIVLESALIIFAVVVNLVNGIGQILSLAADIALIYIIIRLLEWEDDKKVSKEINERLKAMKNNSDYIDEIEE